MDFHNIDGSCHCGNVRFELRWPASEAVIPIRQCGCDFCSKHGGAWTSHPESELAIQVSDPSVVSRYRFGTKTADFLVCATCGVVPVVLSEIDNILYAVVNANTFADVGALEVSRRSTDFDAEDRKSRLNRRQRNWISKVKID